MKPHQSQSSPLQTNGKRKETKPPKRIYELHGPCGKLYAQARTPDQARGVYLANFPELPRDLECIAIAGESVLPTKPYCVIQGKRNRPTVIKRFP